MLCAAEAEIRFTEETMFLVLYTAIVAAQVNLNVKLNMSPSLLWE